MKSLVFEAISKREQIDLTWQTDRHWFVFRQNDYTLRKGTTQVLSTNVKKIDFDIVNEKVKTTTAGEAMELA